MKKQAFQAKTKEDAIKLALESVNANKDEVIIIEKMSKKTLFSKKEEIEVILKEDVNKEIKNYLLNLIKSIDESANLEIKIREDIPLFNIISEKSILIGKNGRTIEALKTIIQAYLNEELKNNYYRFMIDVNDYNQNRKVRLEKLAKYTAKNVARTKVEASLDPMNSYERRIIHSVLSNSKDVETISFGEEPNRYVVIRPKTEK